MLEIKHFRLIEAIHRTGSISAAARELGYSQPALSQQLRQLERVVRTPVVHRVGRTSRLTQAGEILLTHGAQAISAAQRATAEIELVAGLQGGELRLTAFPSASATIVPLALADFTRAYPGVAVRLMESERQTAVEQLAAGEADIAVVGQYYTQGGQPAEVLGDWVWRTLLEEEVYVALPADHRAAAEAEVALGELAGERWIAGCEECRSNLTEAAAAVGFTPKVSFETDDYIALQRLSAAGLGVALIPQLMVQAARVDPHLVLRRTRPARRRRVSTLVTPSALRVPGIVQLQQALQVAGERVLGAHAEP